jgi:hypothetical protein
VIRPKFQQQLQEGVGPASPTATLRKGLDESVEGFIKLKELQPQQQALQAILDRDGKLSEDDQEALDFINDEIGRLIEILHKHGFNFPQCDSSNFTSPLPLLTVVTGHS